MKPLITSLALLSLMFIFFPLFRDSGTIGANSSRSGLTPIPPVQAGARIAVVSPMWGSLRSGVQLGFGANPGQSKSSTLGIRSVGTTDLTVHSISDPGPPFELTNLPILPLVLSPGNQADFTVTFSPTSEGVFSGTIIIGSDDPDAPTVDVLFRCDGKVQDIPPSVGNTPQQAPNYHIFVKGLLDLAEKLEKREVYTGTFIHPFTGEKMTREIKGIVDGKWTYIEQMPNGGKMVCQYSDERRKEMAQYYEYQAKAWAKGSISFSAKIKFDSRSASGNEAKTTTKIDGEEIRNILQEMTDSGECVVLGYGYDPPSLKSTRTTDAKVVSTPAPKVNFQQNFEPMVTQDRNPYFNVVKVVRGHVFIQSDSPEDFNVGTIYEIVRGNEANYVEIGRAKVALKKGSTIALQVIQSSGPIQINDKIKYNK